jgi:hypothetical protein
MNYTVIVKETFKTIWIAYPDAQGMDKEDDLLNYEAQNPEIELIFTEDKESATNILKTFNL